MHIVRFTYLLPGEQNKQAPGTPIHHLNSIVFGCPSAYACQCHFLGLSLLNHDHFWHHICICELGNKSENIICNQLAFIWSMYVLFFSF